MKINMITSILLVLCLIKSNVVYSENDTNIPSPQEFVLNTNSTGSVSYAYGGFFAEIDEFPFMAILEYRKRNGDLVIACGGSLINSRHILTAAHCVTGLIEKKYGKLVSVRLGEYDTRDFVDCVNGICADPAIRIGVEKVFVHENYDANSFGFHNDVAIVYLQHIVIYTRFIQPINLPGPNFEASLPGSTLVIVGWGRTLTARQSPVKVKVDLPVWDQSQCAEKLATHRFVLRNSELCAGGEYKKDSCDGDSGGPLLKKDGYTWVLEGIVSFGNKCGLENWPGIYTRVSYYIDWIEDIIDKSQKEISTTEATRS